MKWTNGYTWYKKLTIEREKERKFTEALQKWNKVFAWKPVVVGETDDEKEIKMWLCYVLKKGTYNIQPHPELHNYWTWEYKENKK